MNIKEAREILSNDEELDIAKLAEAHLEEQKHEIKTHVPSLRRSLVAWSKLKIKRRDEEIWRRRVRDALKKNSS